MSSTMLTTEQLRQAAALARQATEAARNIQRHKQAIKSEKLRLRRLASELEALLSDQQ